jgi:hypothetical protein
MMAFGARHLHWYWRQTSFHEDNMPYRVLSVRLTTILTPNGERCLKVAVMRERVITPADIDAPSRGSPGCPHCGGSDRHAGNSHNGIEQLDDEPHQSPTDRPRCRRGR